MRQCEPDAVASVVAHQKPACAPLLNHVHAVASCGPQRLAKKGVDVPKRLVEIGEHLAARQKLGLQVR